MMTIPETVVELRLTPSGTQEPLWLRAKMSSETHGALTVVDDLGSGLLKLLRTTGLMMNEADNVSLEQIDLAALALVELHWGGVLEPTGSFWIEVPELGGILWNGTVSELHITIQGIRVPAIEP